MRTISGIRRNVKNHGRCSIFVDGEFFAACPIDVALALGLKKGIELTHDLERRLRSEDRRMVLRQKAYRFATYKPRTEQQVRTQLVKLEATPEEVDAVMEWLTDFRLIDDREYVRRFISASHERKPLSPAATRRALMQRGIEKSLIDDEIDHGFTDEQTIELAVRVAEKKRRMLKPGTPADHKDRITRFLQYRGYQWPVIRAVLDRLFILTAIMVAVVAADLTAQTTLTCQRTRLPRTVNDYQPATLPLIAPDGALYFDRKLHPLNEGGSQDPDDVWISRRNGDQQWSEPQREEFTKVKRPDVVFNYTADGLSAFVAGPYHAGSQQSSTCFAILHRRSLTSVFDSVESITLPAVSGLGKNYFGHLSDDRSAIVVALERTGGRGDLDLYVSQRCNGAWSELRSLGPQINTAGLEGAPWLAHDGRTLYFSSNGRDDRKGKADLYVVRRLDDSWTSWSSPNNLGSCINTVEDESSISLVGRGDTALITSWDAESGRPGMYQVVVDPNVRAEPVVLFSTEVRDAMTNALLTNVRVEVVDSAAQRDCPRTYWADTVSGLVRFPLAQRGRYTVITTSSGYVPHRQVIGVQQLDSTSPLRITTKLFDGRKPLVSVFFERGSYTISPEQAERLRSAIAQYDLHQIRFEVMGFTDQLGTAPRNTTLSQQRADAVRELLGQIGIEPQKIVASGKGIEKVDIDISESDEGRPESRRVDIYPAP